MHEAEPGHVSEYRLTLDLDGEAGRWRGTVAFRRPGSAPLTLDADGLSIRAVREAGAPAPFEVRPAERHLVLGQSGRPPGEVEVDFEGTVAERALIGLYRSRCGDGQMLTTQCEPTGARKIFPCLDRPDRRARIRLTVVADAALEVVSNTAPESVREEGARRRWTFGPTPPMATYLF